MYRKEPQSIDRYVHVILAKTTSKESEYQAQIDRINSELREKGKDEIQLHVEPYRPIGMDATRVDRSSFFHEFVSRNEEPTEIHTRFKRCGCNTCFVGDRNKPIGLGCECLKRCGWFLKHKIHRITAGGAAAVTRTVIGDIPRNQPQAHLASCSMTTAEPRASRRRCSPVRPRRAPRERRAVGRRRTGRAASAASWRPRRAY